MLQMSSAPFEEAGYINTKWLLTLHLTKSTFDALTHSLIHHFEIVPNSKKM